MGPDLMLVCGGWLGLRLAVSGREVVLGLPTSGREVGWHWGAAGPGACMRHPLAPPHPPPPRVLKHSGAGAVAPTAPNFLSHA